MSKPIFEINVVDIYDKEHFIIENELKKLTALFKSDKFKKYIGEKCLKVLDTLMQENLGNFNEHSVFDAKVEEYKKNCKYEIENDYLIIYNDTILTQDEMTWVSDKTKKNYQEGISISKIIEYGTGLLGESTPEDNWETNVNNYSSSWSYIGPDNLIHHTQGIEGRYIFNKMMEQVQENFELWVDEYIEKEMD